MVTKMRRMRRYPDIMGQMSKSGTWSSSMYRHDCWSLSWSEWWSRSECGDLCWCESGCWSMCFYRCDRSLE